MNKPTGLVTFLFTDIEGSTSLAQDFPELLPSALEKHHAILYKATESNNGFVYEIVGDAFCCAFHNAVDAIKAAIEAQFNLYSEKWDDVKIKIRIGIHSGNVEWNGKRYMGYITLARTARVMSAAYGEQIIISNDAYELSKEKIPNKISFRDLGERRLKDLKQPVRLFQILSDGLREDFPPLKTLDVRPNNLPVQLTSFIGRELEIKVVKDLLKQTHLLTLTGSGGTGKTRFALQLAADLIDDYVNGVWFVELASLSDPAFLPQAIMKVFELKEEPKRSLEDTLCEYLKEKEMLIILDNCEHLVGASAKLTEKLLSNSPKLKIIATSREGLSCKGEQTHRVLSLDVPDPKDENSPEQLSQYEAVRLFIERALAVDSTFRINNNNAPALAEICFQLDGIPLAIELAAARTKILSVEQIYQRLNDRFNLLTGGKRTALPRQQTLKALIDWSYDLLSEKEQILWRRLSVFVGGWTLEAAEEVCSDEKIKKENVLELLDKLTEKSIIFFEREKERYGMLETIKQYGDDKIKDSSERKKFSTKHFKYYMNFAENAEKQLYGPQVTIWLGRFDDENANIEKSLQNTNNANTITEGLSLVSAVGYYWEIRGNIFKGINWFEKLLDNSKWNQSEIKGKVYTFLGTFYRIQGELYKAEEFYEEGLSIHRRAGNKAKIANSLNSLGNLLRLQGKYEEARILHEESLSISIESNNKQGIVHAQNNIGLDLIDIQDFKTARRIFEDNLIICRELGYKAGIAISLVNLIGELESENMKESQKEMIEESLSIFREMDYKQGIGTSLFNLGSLEAETGNNVNAMNHFRESLLIFYNMGARKNLLGSMLKMTRIKVIESEYEHASELIGAISILLESIEMKFNGKQLDMYESTIIMIKENFGEQGFVKYFNKGKTLSLDVCMEILLK